MENKKQNIILSLSLTIAFILALGLSYAYFSAKLYGVENASTISLKGGKMTIDYVEGANITLSGIYPKEEAWASKTFTLTGNNNTTDNMKYKIGLIIEQNTFSEEAITYSLENTLNEGGTVVEDVDESPIIKTTGTQYIGYGYFGTSTNTHHTYNLKIYFKPNGEDQNEDQKAKFKAKITVEECLDEDLITVTFNADGGTLANNTKTVLANGVYGTLPTPTKEGYEFLGWNGKNLLNYNNIENVALTRGIKVTTDGYIYDVTPTSDNRSWYYSNSNWFINLEAKKYYINIASKNAFSSLAKIKIITETSDIKESTLNGRNSYVSSFTLAENKTVGILVKGYTGVYRIQIEEGNESTLWEPYYLTSDTNIVQNQNHTLKAIWQEVS